MTLISSDYLIKLWDVFFLFTVPIGGGIPAGVLLAKSRGIDWQTMTVLYFISDLLLALLFEPMMMLFIWACSRSTFLMNLSDHVKQATARTLSGYGATPGPFMLVVISFGVDPMTGRAAAQAAGHNFFSGWAIAIMGDMIFFAVLAISTLCLNSILGDGTWTMIIIMGAMFGIPPLIRRFKDSRNHLKT
ncbi:MAG: hypothetical protein H7256_08320 [Bdellovibrio sp.]|nr:hypothetical protein [Bdellovibrio sp.]